MRILIATLKEAFFEHTTRNRAGLIAQFIFSVLLIACLFKLWAGFLPPNKTFNAPDWQKEYDYYSVLKQAVTEGKTPYHISGTYQTTNRFLAIPEVDFSPQIILLKWLDVREYMRYNLLFLLLMGFLGLTLLAKQFKLGFLTFAFLSILFFMNGHITSHISGGHYMWVGYFLLPWFFLSLIKLKDNPGLSNAAKTALSIAIIFMTGGFHIAVWCLLLVLLTGLFNKKLLGTTLVAILISAVLLSFRLIPAMLTYYGNAGAHVRGFFSLSSVFEALVIMHPQNYIPLGWQTSWTEYNTFIDLVGLLAISYFGIYLSVKDKSKEITFKPFYWPLGLIFIFTLSKIGWMPIPPFNSEKVATRMLIIPVLFMGIITATRMQLFLNKQKINAVLAVICGAGLILFFTSLYMHMELWKPVGLTMDGNLSFYRSKIVEITDPPYKSAFNISLLISAAAFLLAISVAFFPKSTKALK